MKRNGSFRRRLFLTLMGTTAISLIVCTGLLILLFEATQVENSRVEADTVLSEAVTSLDALTQELTGAAYAVSENQTIAHGLSGGTESARVVYAALYAATEGHRGAAQFSLYDANGYSRFSTVGQPKETTLPQNRGVLYAARGQEGIVWSSNESTDGCRAAQAIRLGADTIAGYTVIDLNRNSFEQAFAGLGSRQGTLLLVDRQWRPIWCSDLEQAETLAPILRARLLADGALDTEDYAYALRTAEQTGFTFVLQQPLATRRLTLRMLSVASGIMVLLGMAACFFVALRLSQQLNEPVETLRSAMQQIESGDLETRIDSTRSDEFGMLADSFDRMAKQLKDNTERLVKGQRELDETQIRMMQAQLNPHFLCNTLDTMKWMGKIHNIPEVAEISTDLADILRTSISTEEFVTLDEELDLLHRYIDIQRIRFPGKFLYTADIPPELLDCIIPKLMLQPLVENAILHGLDSRDSGTIHVSARQIGNDRMQITVTDNGCGISEKVLRALQNSRDLREGGHLGLYNVNMILKKYYGADYGLTLHNEEAGGASVFAVLPILRKEERC